MTAKLRLELENATKKGFDDIVKDLEKMGIKGKDTEKALELLNKELESRAASELSTKAKQLAEELDGTAEKARQLETALAATHATALASRKSLQELSETAKKEAASAGKAADFHRDLEAALNDRKVRAYREQIDRLADEMSGLTTQAKKAEGAILDINRANQQGGGKLDAVANGWLTFASKAHVAAMAVKGVWEGGKQVGEFISYMSDKGVPAFQSLANAGAKVSKSLVDGFKKQEFEDFGRTISVGIEKLAIPSLNSLISKTGSFASAVTRATDRLLQMAGVDLKKIRQDIEGAEKAANEFDKWASDQKTKASRGWEGFAMGVHAATARSEAEQAARRDEFKTIAEVDAEVDKANEQVGKYVAAIATANDRDYEAAKRNLEKQLTIVEQLEAKRAQITKERQEKEKEREKSLRDAKMAAEKKSFEEELKHIDTLLRESTQSADKIKELEERRFKLVKENKERERKLAIEAGTLEQKLFEEDMARIEARKKKEREAALAGIENERKLYLAREHRRDLERQAEQEKVNKFKEFLTSGGGGGAGFNIGGSTGNTQLTFAPTFGGGGGGGHDCCCPCPGGGGGGMGMSGGSMPMGANAWGGMTGAGWYPGGQGGPGWRGPGLPMPVGWNGQGPWPGGVPKPRPDPIGLLTGGITPKNVWDKTVSNAQDDAEKKRIEEGQANGTLDQNGKPIDYKKEEEREKSKYVREKIAQGFKRFGVDIGPQQSHGDERKTRAGWNDLPTTYNTFFGDPDGADWRGKDVRDESGRKDLVDKDGRFIPVDSEAGQELLRKQKAAQEAKLKAATEARNQAEGSPYKRIEELRKQEEEQQRKQDAAEQTRKQGEADKSANLPELKKKEEEESKKLADIQKAKNEELKKVREFEEKRRQESSSRTKAAKEKSDKWLDDQRSQDKEWQESKDAEDAAAKMDHAERGAEGPARIHWKNDDGTVGSVPLWEDMDRERNNSKDKRRRDKERKFSPDYGPETPKQRADARKAAEAKAKGATRKTKAAVKQRKNVQGRRGEISGPETTRAYHDLVKEQVGQLKAQGKLDSTQMQAIEQLLDATREQSQMTAELQEQMDQLIEAIAELRGFRPSKSRRQAGR